MDMGSVTEVTLMTMKCGCFPKAVRPLFPERIGGRPEASEYNPDETINKAIYHGQPMDK
jgi:hypothetical protein